MTTQLLDTEIKYDRETRDYAITVCGVIVGFASTYSQAEEVRTRVLAERAQDGYYHTATLLDGDSLDPADGTPGVDDNDPSAPADPDPAPGRRLIFTARHTAIRCASCDTPILLGPVVCDDCKAQGYCTVCGQEHRPTQCPDVVKVRHEMMAAERASRWTDEDRAADRRSRAWSRKLLEQIVTAADASVESYASV